MAKEEKEQHQYRTDTVDLDLGSPEYVLTDYEGNEYWSIGDIAKGGIHSSTTLQNLARDGRLEGIKPSGHDWFVSIDSYRDYLETGRQKPGPKPQTKN